MNRRDVIKALLLSPIAMKSLTDLEAYADTLAKSERMPALFLGHGSPMNAIEENEFVRGFRKAAQSIPAPKAILCVSAHWFTRGTRVTAMKMPRTIHDFGGFPRELYEVQYPAPGSPELASEAAALLHPTQVAMDDQWGLDHGAWSVIKHLFPDADVPVVQLSIDRTQGPEHHYQLGKQIDALRDRGILVVGSGNIVHNLGLVDFAGINRDNHGFDWAFEARDLFNTSILSGDYSTLLRYHEQGKAVRLSIPTPDHFLPLLYVLGMKRKDEQVRLFNDKLVGGSISMTSVQIA